MFLLCLANLGVFSMFFNLPLMFDLVKLMKFRLTIGSVKILPQTFSDCYEIVTELFKLSCNRLLEIERRTIEMLFLWGEVQMENSLGGNPTR